MHSKSKQYFTRTCISSADPIAISKWRLNSAFDRRRLPKALSDIPANRFAGVADLIRQTVSLDFRTSHRRAMQIKCDLVRSPEYFEILKYSDIRRKSACCIPISDA